MTDFRTCKFLSGFVLPGVQTTGIMIMILKLPKNRTIVSVRVYYYPSFLGSAWGSFSPPLHLRPPSSHGLHFHCHASGVLVEPPLNQKSTSPNGCHWDTERYSLSTWVRHFPVIMVYDSFGTLLLVPAILSTLSFKSKSTTVIQNSRNKALVLVWFLLWDINYPPFSIWHLYGYWMGRRSSSLANTVHQI